MARKTKTVTIAGGPGNRDNNKSFLLTELPADQAERWAMRMLLAIANSGGKLPEGSLDAGMAGVAAMVQHSLVVGLKALAGLRFEDAEPLLDTMFSCIQYAPPPVNGARLPLQSITSGTDSQIEEVSTRLTLRWEVLQLHLNFSLDAFRSTSGLAPTSPPEI